MTGEHTETTPVWFVKQQIVRERTVMIQAWTEDEAKQRAQAGYGEVVEQGKPCLLASTAERDDGLI
jgi:hypothetical protein